MVSNIGLEVHDIPSPYPLGWVNKDIEPRVTKQCKIKFSISVYCIDILEVDVASLNVCDVVFQNTCVYKRDAIFMMSVNQYYFIKYEIYSIINAHKGN